MGKKTLITGITGQDGSYLAEFLLSKVYEVHGLIRRASTFNTYRIDHIYVDPHMNLMPNFSFTMGTCRIRSKFPIFYIKFSQTKCYHLGAQSHVRVSFDMPEYTGNVTALGTERVLEAIRRTGNNIKFYQASSSEMFGRIPPPQNEETTFSPTSPYAVAKIYAYWMTKNYREGYQLFASNGILFNHESPRRGEIFVTRKTTMAIANILARKQTVLFLGNLASKARLGLCSRIRRSYVANSTTKGTR